MKQYFSYFKYLFIGIGVLVLLTVLAEAVKISMSGRSNHSAPEERVYDEADVLTAKEEEKLRDLIAKREKQIGCDIVLVTIDRSLLTEYGLEDTDANWEYSMRNYADDFYDENQYGYNKDFEGDGVLLLDNWYEGEEGSYLSTSGRVYQRFSSYMIDDLLDDVSDEVEDSPYKAYRIYIEDVYRQMARENSLARMMNPLALFIITLVIALIYVASHLKYKEGEKTTSANTYVENGSVRFNVKKDTLVNKVVTSRVIESSSSGSGSGHSSGGGGGHHSSSGASHGGGGHRR